MLMRGCTILEMANALQVTESTVKYHLTKLYKHANLHRSGPFIPAVRLVYLEAVNRGMIKPL
jgi:DNA-binding NarL/FixJ family response regulator